MGVILGTGTNACYPEDRERGGTVINIEWGSFDKFARSSFDEELDLASVNRGEQLFEKAVSGMYLGEVFRIALRDALKPSSGGLLRPYSISGENLSQIAADAFDLKSVNVMTSSDAATARTIAASVSKRSARLAASAVASVILWRDKELKEGHVVAIDGSLFEKYPGYSEEMRLFLGEMLGANAEKISFELAKDGSGAGAAILAAVAAASREIS
jgi:hexokinase